MVLSQYGVVFLCRLMILLLIMLLVVYTGPQIVTLQLSLTSVRLFSTIFWQRKMHVLKFILGDFNFPNIDWSLLTSVKLTPTII